MIVACKNSGCCLLIAAAAFSVSSGTLRGAPDARNLTIEQVLDRMERADNERTANLRNYSVVRHYTLSTQRFDQYAEMLVRMNYTAPGTKVFDVLSQTGSGFVQARAFRTIMKAEVEAASDDVREQTRVNRNNYHFKLLGTEVLNGRPSYLIEITPKANRRYQMRGRIWVDMEDFAVARMEGEPVGKTSWWLRNMHMRQDYRKLGEFWLPGSSETDSDVRFVGSAHLKIEFLDYEVNRAPEQRRASAAR